MITGTVTAAREAVFTLPILDANNQPQDTTVIIDTGFTGWLTLPPNVIAALGLSWRRRGRAILADGNEIQFDVFEATVIWDGQQIVVPVSETDSDPLVGMNLIYGYELFIQAVDGGAVTLKKL